MSLEFTGERVVPGRVDTNLWNEHFARYAFASRLARHRRTLDAGCGAGYGAAELATTASSVTAIDLSYEAVAFGREQFAHPRVRWAQGSCEQIPFASGCFDLVVAFEVIEHLSDWRNLVSEAKRVLAPGGQFVVSTPNKDFYAETRAQAGPNPFHTVEFTFDEFRAALAEFFPYISFFLEDHTEGVLFRSLRTATTNEVRLEDQGANAEQANFYIAVCALTPQTGSPNFVFLPSSANLLKERFLHIAKLESELALKNEWLSAARNDHAKLHELYLAQTQELKERTEWAENLDSQLIEAGRVITKLQSEVEEERALVNSIAARFESRIAELESQVNELRNWGEETERHLTSELESARSELARCLDALHATEATLEERTKWALSLDARLNHVQGLLSAAQVSRWIRLGRAFGIGPNLT